MQWILGCYNIDYDLGPIIHARHQLIGCGYLVTCNHQKAREARPKTNLSASSFPHLYKQETCHFANIVTICPVYRFQVLALLRVFYGSWGPCSLERWVGLIDEEVESGQGLAFLLSRLLLIGTMYVYRLTSMHTREACNILKS